jgi:putative Ca2+/H+ antiporter (TMEM165/GDT1 family)
VLELHGRRLVRVQAKNSLARQGNLSLEYIVEAFLNTALVVALGEMGDKTQLLALLLAARYRKPWPIVLGILLATIASMGITAWLGSFVSHLIPPQLLRWVLVVMFFGVALWTLLPEKDDDEAHALKSSASLVLTAFTTFLLAELGDKSQAATFVMAAKYQQFLPVMAGSTLGEMLAIVPAVFLGKTTAQWLPLKSVRIAAAGVFAALGVWVLLFGLG